MNDEWQYSNPFYMDGYMAASVGGKTSDCPYDYTKFEDVNDVKSEMYRQTEWYAGFRNFNNKTEVE